MDNVSTVRYRWGLRTCHTIHTRRTTTRSNTGPHRSNCCVSSSHQVHAKEGGIWGAGRTSGSLWMNLVCELWAIVRSMNILYVPWVAFFVPKNNSFSPPYIHILSTHCIRTQFLMVIFHFSPVFLSSYGRSLSARLFSITIVRERCPSNKPTSQVNLFFIGNSITTTPIPIYNSLCEGTTKGIYSGTDFWNFVMILGVMGMNRLGYPSS